MTDKRNRVITSYLHATCRAIFNLLVQRRMGTLVIGKNVGWKQAVKMGSARIRRL
jgi:putative transposase